MPWYTEQTKDVASCDKPRIDANNQSSEDFRMGQPVPGHAGTLPAEYIGRVERTEGTETSNYLQEKKVITIPQVAASERGRA